MWFGCYLLVGTKEGQSNNHEIYLYDGGRIFNYREVGFRLEDAGSDADTEEDVDLDCRHHDVTLMFYADKSQHDHVS